MKYWLCLLLLGQINHASSYQDVDSPSDENTKTSEMNQEAGDREGFAGKKEKRRHYIIDAHRPNYLMPLTYNASTNDDAVQNLAGKLQDFEIKYQISFKIPVWSKIVLQNLDLKFAYTQQGYWQAFNGGISRPFREINHEPEFFLSLDTGNDDNVFQLERFRLGLSHKSNGRSPPFSRNWDHIYVDWFWSSDNKWLMSYKQYFILSPGERLRKQFGYKGYGEFNLIRRFGEQSINFTFKQYLDSKNRSGVEASYSFPLTKSLKGYIQVFNGYGESQLDYDDSVMRVGLGLLLTDWF